MTPYTSSSSKRSQWEVRCTLTCSRTVNPIRSIVENLCMEPHPDKPFIALSIGDPTIFRNLNASQVAVEALVESAKSLKYNGYANSVGHEESREAVAKYSSTNEVKYTAEDIILTSGCSAALDSCITCLANPGQNIVIPKPGFPICKTLAGSLDIQVKYYNLLPNKDWQVDLDDLKSQIDANTVAIVINNPSNPCGSVYSAEHLLDILQIARNNFLPIIADEVYEYMVFKGHIFFPIASLSSDVPVLTCSGLTKRHLLPGWRVGWVKVHDPLDILRKEVRPGLTAINQKTLGCNTLAQGALPKILTEVPEEFFQNTIDVVERHAYMAYKTLVAVPGLKPTLPQGAMYMMVGVDLKSFPEFNSEIKFIEQMVKEESVFCLPGLCFNYPGYMRLVLTVPDEFIVEACRRISEFCQRYYKPQFSKNHHAIQSADLKKKKLIIMPFTNSSQEHVKTN